MQTINFLKNCIKLEINNSLKKIIIYFKKLLIINNLLVAALFYSYIKGTNINDKEKNWFKIEKDYINNKFALITRDCGACGLFSFYIVNLGCIHKYLAEGFIPIIDMKYLPNAINGYNTSRSNYWEYFFEQPFGYSLDEVLKNSKNITRIICGDCLPRPDEISMLFNEPRKNFWHNFANKYLLIKMEILILAKKIMYHLFKNSKNILGVLTRGTDYISKKPYGHPIPPDIVDLIYDVKEMDNKYVYDFIFFSTEDEILRDKFTKSFPDKVKIIKTNIKINYNYNKADYINNNSNIKGNIEFNKIYLLNIIILSKCLDLITAQCSGTAGIFVLSKGFRNVKIYNLGRYH